MAVYNRSVLSNRALCCSLSHLVWYLPRDSTYSRRTPWCPCIRISRHHLYRLPRVTSLHPQSLQDCWRTVANRHSCGIPRFGGRSPEHLRRSFRHHAGAELWMDHVEFSLGTRSTRPCSHCSHGNVIVPCSSAPLYGWISNLPRSQQD